MGCHSEGGGETPTEESGKVNGWWMLIDITFPPNKGVLGGSAAQNSLHNYPPFPGRGDQGGVGIKPPGNTVEPILSGGWVAIHIVELDLSDL